MSMQMRSRGAKGQTPSLGRAPIATKTPELVPVCRKTRPLAAAIPLQTAPSKIDRPAELNIPAVMDAASAAWQVWREPAQGKQFMDETADGTTVQYLNQEFVTNHFAGVLKVNVLAVKTSVPSLPWNETSGIRVTYNGTVAIAGFYDNDSVDGTGSAYLWVPKGEESTEPLTLKVERVEARNRDLLTFSPSRIVSSAMHEIGEAARILNGSSTRLALLEGAGIDATVTLQVKFIPLTPQLTPLELTRLDEDVLTDRRKILTSITAGSETYTLKGPEDRTLYSLKGASPYVGVLQDPIEASERNPDDIMYESGLLMGKVFSGGFWSTGSEEKAVAYIDDKATDTEIAMFWNQDLKKFMVVFNSTSSSADSYRNLNVRPARFEESSTGIGPLDSKTVWPWGNSDKYLVHLGYIKAWRSVQPTVEKLLKDAAASVSGGSKQRWKTFFVGHSLGGALATIATASAVAQGREADIGGLYTFGSPHVGNHAFLNAFTKRIPQCWRVFNRKDLIPHALEYVPWVFQPKATGVAFSPVPSGQVHGSLYEGFDSCEEDKCIEEQLVMNVSFVGTDPDVVHPITVVPGRPIPDDVRSKIVVEYPGDPSTWTTLSMAWQGTLTDIHTSIEHFESLISLVKRAALQTPGLSTEENKEMLARLHDVDCKICQRYMALERLEGDSDNT